MLRKPSTTRCCSNALGESWVDAVPVVFVDTLVPVAVPLVAVVTLLVMVVVLLSSVMVLLLLAVVSLVLCERRALLLRDPEFLGSDPESEEISSVVLLPRELDAVVKPEGVRADLQLPRPLALVLEA